MDLIKLEYFYTTAKFENMSLAAKELLISQPALSKAIKNLEAELEMDLFFRNGRRITLNENGKFLFKRAEHIFSAIRDLERGLDEIRGNENGKLSIVTTLPYIFTKIIDLFFNEYPHVKYQQVSLSKENLKQFIENGKYDLCITTKKIEHPNIEWLPLFEEEIFLSVPESYKEEKKGTIRLKELDNLPLVGLTNQYSFRQMIDQYCKSIGYSPDYQIEVEEATMVMQLVKNGRGAAFTPETAVLPSANKIKHLKIIDGKFTRTIGLLRHRYSYPTKISKAFVKHCHRYFQDFKKEI
ncbi:LysR family transcriptional regulator [Sporosarcina ureilytica]|uniref:Transcriptional regulator n=1 Tax=Sporosarcina ureilytica TaxID=298596 RepID=A0A1D8JFJ2_9BACL|nr:LysR family transcriptional regulator [Sporosarcina ureilytica]AOV07475.1 transcriptional regulator [Sporosarcina ureilytica]